MDVDFDAFEDEDEITLLIEFARGQDGCTLVH